MFLEEMLLCYIVDTVDKTTGMVRFRFNNLQQYYILHKMNHTERLNYVILTSERIFTTKVCETIVLQIVNVVDVSYELVNYDGQHFQFSHHPSV